jgi:hypothetical protein
VHNSAQLAVDAVELLAGLAPQVLHVVLCGRAAAPLGGWFSFSGVWHGVPPIEDHHAADQHRAT